MLTPIRERFRDPFSNEAETPLWGYFDFQPPPQTGLPLYIFVTMFMIVFSCYSRPNTVRIQGRPSCTLGPAKRISAVVSIAIDDYSFAIDKFAVRCFQSTPLQSTEFSSPSRCHRSFGRFVCRGDQPICVPNDARVIRRDQPSAYPPWCPSLSISTITPRRSITSRHCSCCCHSTPSPSPSPTAAFRVCGTPITCRSRGWSCRCRCFRCTPYRSGWRCASHLYGDR